MREILFDISYADLLKNCNGHQSKLTKTDNIIFGAYTVLGVVGGLTALHFEASSIEVKNPALETARHVQETSSAARSTVQLGEKTSLS